MARIALGASVKEGPRRGKVVAHRPKGMVDVQFSDVEWVERRPEAGLRGNPPRRQNWAQVVVQVVMLLLPSIIDGGKRQWAKFQRADHGTRRKMLRKWAWAAGPAARAAVVSDAVADKAIRYLVSEEGKRATDAAFRHAADPRTQRALVQAAVRNPQDVYDPGKEQFRRVVTAIYEQQRKEGKSHRQAQSAAYAIATREGQRHGWLEPGTQTPTAKGRKAAREKLGTADAWAKRQRYEVMHARSRKSGRHRVVPEVVDGRTRYYIQPGGTYRFSEDKARAEADRLNSGYEGRRRRRVAANPPKDMSPVVKRLLWEMYGLGPNDVDLDDETAYLRDEDKAREAIAALGRKYDLDRIDLPGPYYRQNWIPVALGVTASVATLGDIAQRKYKARKGKKKGTENPREYSDLGGMSRGLAGMPSVARNALSDARALGRLKGLKIVALDQVPPSRKQRFETARRGLEAYIDEVDRKIERLLASVLAQIPGGEYGRRSEAAKAAQRGLWGAYKGETSEVLHERERKRAARRSRRVTNPTDLPPDWAERMTGRSKVHRGKRTRGIAAAGVGDYWAQISTSAPGEYVPPKLFRAFDEDGEDVYYLVFEGRNKRRSDFIRSKILASNREPGLRGGRWKRDSRVTNMIFRDRPGSLTQVERFSIRPPASGRGSQADPWRVIDAKTGRIVFTSTRKPEADKELRKRQDRTPREFVGTAGDPISAYYTTSPDRARWVVAQLEGRGIEVERTPEALRTAAIPPSRTAPRRGRKRKLTRVQEARKRDELAELEAQLAQIRDRRSNPYPVRQNFVAATGRALLTGGKWLVKSETGRKVLAEAAVIGTMMVGDKLMKKGKVSPEVMRYIQARVEKETGRKPTKSQVTKALVSIDPNKDGTLNVKEVVDTLEKQ